MSSKSTNIQTAHQAAIQTASQAALNPTLAAKNRTA
jgi:hypothetical protein